MPSRRAVVLAALFALAAGCRRHASSGTVKVAAAADLARAFEELGPAFTAKTGHKVVFTFGSSGLLAKQIGEGAPYDLYAAANASYVTQVIDEGVCDATTRTLYAQGRIVVWSRGAKVGSLAELADPRFGKIAIANPDHAPYGKAARQALQHAGVWDQVSGKLVFGENVQQTKQWAQDGSADAAIIALSLSIAGDGGTTLPIDPSFHDPLDQQLVVCGNGEEADAARQFAGFISSREGR
jgi:molybdate transport system substrate-binding protein